MEPPTSERNFTPSSTAELSASMRPGVAELGQIELGVAGAGATVVLVEDVVEEDVVEEEVVEEDVVEEDVDEEDVVEDVVVDDCTSFRYSALPLGKVVVIRRCVPSLASTSK